MAAQGGARRPSRPGRRDLPFVPRVVNPVRVEEVILLAAAEEVRAARRAIESALPWTKVRVCSNPLALQAACADRPTVVVVDDTALNLADIAAARRCCSRLVVVLLSAHRLVQASPPAFAREACPYVAQADLVFAVDATRWAPERTVLAAIRAAEDHLNIEQRPDVHRFIFLVVDDEPRWFSEFLPVLYEIIGQRAGVRLARTFEEASRFLFGTADESEMGLLPAVQGHGDDVIGLITDMYFPRGGVVTGDAGRALVELVACRYPRIPIIVASKTREADELCADALVLPKGDPGFLPALRAYIRDRTGMGDFVIADRDGQEWYRLKDVRDMRQMLVEASSPEPTAEELRRILSAYGEQDRFSSWFHMHGFRRLADRLRPERLTGEPMVALLRRELTRELARVRRTPLVLDGHRVTDLPTLLAVLRSAPPERIQAAADHDTLSGWLDLQGCSELADDLRPVHGRGVEFREAVAAVVAKWMDIYSRRAGRKKGKSL